MLWNFYGKELIIISKKSLSYNYDYGFYKTRLNIIPINQLRVYTENITDKKNVLSKIAFTDYSAEDDLPEDIHKTTLYLKANEAENLIGMINTFYVNDDSSIFFNPN